MPNLFNYEKLDRYTFDSMVQNSSLSIYNPHFIKKRKQENIQVDSLKTIFCLQNKKDKKILSAVILNYKNYHNQDFYEVKYAFSNPEGQGYMKYLFNVIIFDFNYTLISDELHTLPGSMDFWLSLRKKRKYELYIYNVNTGHKRKYENYPISKIWGMDLDGDNEMKEYLVETMWEARTITKKMYEFVTSNIENIEDRRMIRLVCQKK